MLSSFAFWATVVLAWVAVSYVVISFIEFVSHGIFMHKPTWFSDHSKFFKETLDEHRTFHHGHCFPGRHFDEKDDHDCVTINIHLRVFFGQMASAWMWGPLFLAAFFLGFGTTAAKVLILGGCIFMVLLLLHHVTWNFIHVQMHTARENRAAWFATSRVCNYLARYHYIHHVYPRSNFCVVCPGADWLMGTFRPANEKDVADLKERGFYVD